ncbi:MAG: hypothetical protein ACI8RW_000145 [Porticoccaceae bacterium]|jgi:hypothetical protein
MSKYTPKLYAERVKKSISEMGHHLTYVSVKESPSFAYSTGITSSYGMPEIFISSLPPGLSGDFISSYISRFAKASLSINNLIQSDDGDAPFDYYLIRVEDGKLDEYVLASIKYYEQAPFEYLQLVFPDTNLKFPHQSGYDYDQEIIGDYSVIEQDASAL